MEVVATRRIRAGIGASSLALLAACAPPSPRAVVSEPSAPARSTPAREVEASTEAAADAAAPAKWWPTMREHFAAHRGAQPSAPPSAPDAPCHVRATRRADKTLLDFQVYCRGAPLPPAPAAPYAERLATAFLELHRADLGLSASANLRVTGSVTNGLIQTTEYAVDGAGAPCTDWRAQIDVVNPAQMFVSRLHTTCRDDDELGDEGRAVLKVLGGAVSRSVVGKEHGRADGTPLPFARTFVHAKTLTPRPDDPRRVGAEVLRELGGDATGYELETTQAGLHLEYRLRPGRKGPCSGHRMTLDVRDYETSFVFVCDGQPAGAACGTGVDCMGGLRCKVEISDFHYARGHCKPR